MASNSSILSALRGDCLPSFINLCWCLRFDTHFPTLGLSLYLLGNSQCPVLSLICFSSSYHFIHGTWLFGFFICHVNSMASNTSILYVLRCDINVYWCLRYDTHIPTLGLSLYLLGTSQCPFVSLKCFSSSYHFIHGTWLFGFFICRVNPMTSNISIPYALRGDCLPSFINLYCCLRVATHLPRLRLSLYLLGHSQCPS